MIRRFTLTAILTATAACYGLATAASGDEPTTGTGTIKAYCLDFNWERRGFAKPGTWKNADPAAHVAWYKAVGANVIQTFAVSCNGYAWYKGGVVPEQPGLKHDFLTEVVKLGHADGMRVMGYFCIGANTRWGKENPALSYGTPSGYHLPYTDAYLTYLSSAITDAVKTTGIDGFMIDWVWQPRRKANDDKWIESEKALYKQLMGEPFPGEKALSKAQEIAYGRKAIDRCWATIHKAAKSANPKAVIWLTVNNAKHPHIVGSTMLKEVDWIMGEKGNLDEILALKSHVGKHTKLITCMSDFGGPNAVKEVPKAMDAGLGLYGYAKPKGADGLIKLEEIFSKQLTELHGNDKRIAVLARAYRGKSLDAIWRDDEFVDPERPLPFEIELRRRSSRHGPDLARTIVEGDKATLSIMTYNGSGKGLVKKRWQEWPSDITIRLSKGRRNKTMPSYLRVANGSVGVDVNLVSEPTVVAGKMEAELDSKRRWADEQFLNGGRPAEPIQIGAVTTNIGDGFVEITLPRVLLQTNPEMLCIEWGHAGKWY